MEWARCPRTTGSLPLFVRSTSRHMLLLASTLVLLARWTSRTSRELMLLRPFLYLIPSSRRLFTRLRPRLPVVSIPGRNVLGPSRPAFGISTDWCVMLLHLKVSTTVDLIRLYTTSNRPRKHRPTRLGPVLFTATTMVSLLWLCMLMVHTGNPLPNAWPIYTLPRLSVATTLLQLEMCMEWKSLMLNCGSVVIRWVNRLSPLIWKTVRSLSLRSLRTT